MDLAQVKLKPYVSFKVGNVIKIKGKQGFRVTVFFDDGTDYECQHSGFETKKSAENERNEVTAQLYKNEYVIYKRVKVKELLDHWLEKVMRPKKGFAANSYNTYKNSIDKHINPKVGNIYILNFNEGHLNKLYKAVAVYKSIPGIVKPIMVTAFQYALSKKLVTRNPCKGIDLPKDLKPKKYHTVEIEADQTYNIEQVKLILVEGKNTRIYLQLLFALLMGLRRSEINGLKYSDIDYENQTLRIRRQLGEDLHKDPSEIAPNTKQKQEIEPKTKSSYRTRDIPDLVFAEILKERERYEKNRSRRQHGKWVFQDLDYIVCSSYGRPRCKTYYYEHYKELIVERLKLPYIKFHDLRHTFTTMLFKNDINMKAIAMALGHANSVISVDVYADKAAIIEDCVKDIQPYILEVHPFSEEDRAALVEMELRKIS